MTAPMLARGRAAQREAVLDTFLDAGGIEEFQADFAKEMICGTARIGGVLVGVIANSRGMVRQAVSLSVKAQANSLCYGL